jgi:hypothetical protein
LFLSDFTAGVRALNSRNEAMQRMLIIEVVAKVNRGPLA